MVPGGGASVPPVPGVPVLPPVCAGGFFNEPTSMQLAAAAQDASSAVRSKALESERIADAELAVSGIEGDLQLRRRLPEFVMQPGCQDGDAARDPGPDGDALEGVDD